MEPPPPDEWHPAYSHLKESKHLNLWLDGKDPYKHQYTMLVIVGFEVLPYTKESDDGSCSKSSHKIRTLNRARCFGIAPYVGRPFNYIWNVGVDDLNRTISGKAQIAYTDEP